MIAGAQAGTSTTSGGVVGSGGAGGLQNLIRAYQAGGCSTFFGRRYSLLQLDFRCEDMKQQSLIP